MTILVQYSPLEWTEEPSIYGVYHCYTLLEVVPFVMLKETVGYFTAKANRRPPMLDSVNMYELPLLLNKHNS